MPQPDAPRKSANSHGVLTTDCEDTQAMADADSTVARIYSDTDLYDVLIASGYGVTLSVRAGHLVIVDGIGRSRRERRIPRMPRTVSRLFIYGTTGFFSLEAARWLSDAGIPWTQASSDGNIIAGSGPTRNDAALIRAQCEAAASDKGLAIARRLITAKLTGQADLLRDLLPDQAAERLIRSQVPVVESAASLSSVMAAEALAARVYWQSWAGRVAVPWSPPDLVRVPDHWRAFSQRPSLMAEANRHATDPANAILNYVYRVAESQAVLACHAAGLHPGIGISHTDVQNRNSMALDLMEAARPVCDRLILAMLAPDGCIPYRDGQPAYFDKRWVTEERDGRCRLVPPLTHSLTAHSADLAAVLLSHALAVAKMLTANTVRLSGRRVPGQPREHYGLPRYRLRPGFTTADLITDELWRELEPLIPVWKRPAGQTGRPRAISNREMAASMIGRYLVGLPWESIPVRRVTLAPRHREWDEAGIWDKIRTVFGQSGDVSGLVE